MALLFATSDQKKELCFLQRNVNLFIFSYDFKNDYISEYILFPFYLAVIYEGFYLRLWPWDRGENAIWLEM